VCAGERSSTLELRRPVLGWGSSQVLDRSAVALLSFALVRGVRDARLALVAAAATKLATISQRQEALFQVLSALLAATVPMAFVNATFAVSDFFSRRLLGLWFAQLHQRMRELLIRLALPCAALSNPDLSTFQPQALRDVRRLQTLLTPTISGGMFEYGNEDLIGEVVYAESFGVFTLAAVRNPLASEQGRAQQQQQAVEPGNDSNEDLETLLVFFNDANPVRLYYIGAYDRWLCVNVALALCTLHALRMIVSAAVMPHKIIWTYYHGGSASVPPPDYAPFPTEDAEHACVICLEYRKDTVIRPCGHLCVCWGCGQSVRARCPVCRSMVLATDFIGRVYH